MIPCGCWEIIARRQWLLGQQRSGGVMATEREGMRVRNGAKGNKSERRSEREWEYEARWNESESESESERDWEWEGMREIVSVVLKGFFSAICRTRGGPKRNRVQWTQFQCIKFESTGLGFYVQKPSPLDSVSMYKNWVQWTRFLGIRGHFVYLSYWKNRKLEYNILDL